MPLIKSITLGLYPKASEGRRQSRPEHTVPFCVSFCEIVHKLVKFSITIIITVIVIEAICLLQCVTAE